MFYGMLAKKLAAMRKSPGKRLVGGPPQPRRPNGARLGVESLEDRRMLSFSPWFAALAHGAGNAAYHGSSGSSSSVAAGTVTLLNRPGTASYGQSVQLTAKVAGATSGNVVFQDTFNGTTSQLDSAPISVSGMGTATFAVNSLAVGTHSIIAQYTDSAGAVTSSTAVTEIIKAATTRTTVSASTNPVVLTGSNTTADVTFTAIVGSGGSCGAVNGQGTAPTGTVTFTVTNTAGGANATVTDTETLDASGKATYPASLAAGTYNVTVTYNGDGNYAASSTAKPLVEQVVAASAIGTGNVATVGTADSLITLRGGQQVSIDVAQALGADGSLAETGAGITYADSTRGIKFTSTGITSVVFDPNGYLAKIVGTGTVTDASGNSTDVAFTLLANAGSGGWRSQPSVAMTITGTGINYQYSGAVISGNLSVTPATAGTVSIPSSGGSLHDRALGEWDGPGPGFGFRGWHRGRW